VQLVADNLKALVTIVALIFAAGVLWNEVQRSVLDAHEIAVDAKKLAVSQAADVDSIKRDVRELKYKQRKQDWMTYRILEKVDPAAARMIPEPENPR
jgi:hypothetical protein